MDSKNKLQNDTLRADIEPFHITHPELLDLRANDAQLRVWLPEHTRLVMNRVVYAVDATLSEYLREFFVVYLYGSDALIQMKQTKTGVFYEPPPAPESSIDDSSGISFSRSRSVEFIPRLGKNIVPLKIFMNKKMKADLQVLADKADMPLSQFVREILVSYFLGHMVWPERKQSLTAHQEALASGWESGRIKEDWIRSPSSEEEMALQGKIEVICL